MSKYRVLCYITYEVESDSAEDARWQVEDGHTDGKSVFAEIVEIMEVPNV